MESADLTLETPLLKIPQELLRANFKSQQKIIERDASWLGSASKQLVDTASNDSAESQLSSMITRLMTLKRKISSSREEEKILLQSSRSRLAHMQGLLTIREAPSTNSDTDFRVQRLIAEFMLRQGHSETAKIVSTRSGIDELLDIDIYVQSKRIVDGLRSGNTQDCLAWCNEHKSALRKNKNNLEFEVRRQEFVELIRAGNLVQAIAYAQKNLASHREGRKVEVDQVCALLCYKEDTEVLPYKSLYAQSRWKFLADLFVHTHHELYSIPSTSPLEVALSAGLSALKTPTCHTYSGNDIHGAMSPATTCPACSLELNELAQNVPYAHAVRSHLVDALTGEAMEGENGPLVLPNGQVYGQKSLQSWSEKQSTREGFIQDPRTGEEFTKTSLRKAYVL